MKAAAALASCLALGCASVPRGAPSFDPAAPTDVWLGRGSGMYGLDVVHVAQDGAMSVDRTTATSPVPGGAPHLVHERATAGLDPSVNADVRRLVSRLHVDRMKDAYRKKGVWDGTQWVLRVRQDGGYDRAIVFDNRFPRAIVRFARDLDALAGAQGIAGEFEPLADEDWYDNQAALWASVAGG